MQIIRVFPTRTHATPIDEDVRIDCGPGLFDEADEIHISVLFTWDMPRAIELAEEWRHVAPVKIGGPATGEKSGDFIPGQYVKPGYVITSRGCPNNCWFCRVPKREGDIRELPIMEGWNLLDDNILACSEKHVRAVFSMLKRNKPCELTGGLEAKRLQDWHIEALADLRPRQMFFAYDTPDDKDPLAVAANKLIKQGFTRHHLRCFVLIGYPGDTFSKSETRLDFCLSIGMMPMAMMYKNNDGDAKPEWKIFQRKWARPAIIVQADRAKRRERRGNIKKGVRDAL